MNYIKQGGLRNAVQKNRQFIGDAAMQRLYGQIGAVPDHNKNGRDQPQPIIKCHPANAFVLRESLSHRRTSLCFGLYREL